MGSFKRWSRHLGWRIYKWRLGHPRWFTGLIIWAMAMVAVVAVAVSRSSSPSAGNRADSSDALAAPPPHAGPFVRAVDVSCRSAVTVVLTSLDRSGTTPATLRPASVAIAREADTLGAIRTPHGDADRLGAYRRELMTQSRLGTVEAGLLSSGRKPVRATAAMAASISRGRALADQLGFTNCFDQHLRFRNR
jgi:hypothetical protein